MPEHVSVVGGGVAGLTSGVFLELKGYDTKIYTKEVPYEDLGVPSVATNYAAASVKPVVVDEDDVGELTRISDGFYEKLEPNTDTVFRQDNFELHGSPVGGPDHADALRSYRTLEEYEGVVPEPKPESGSADGVVDGWVHEIFFVEMPKYVPGLIDLYESEGGTVERRELTKDRIGALPGDVVVNCTGYGNIFEDDAVVAKRGHLLEVETDGRLTDRDGERFSYSYYPEADDTETGGFVYAYPRRDCLLLGGSEQVGKDVGGEWVGEEADRTVSTGGIDVPARLVELNAELIEKKCGTDIRPREKRGRAGYRPYRHGGIRTERETYDGKEIVHNYGHGGAGVTLSWYSANEVYNLVSGSEGFEYETLEGVEI
jgi:D-amino-acid oxidase